jgi:SAM-dependent methyltransferase
MGGMRRLGAIVGAGAVLAVIAAARHRGSVIGRRVPGGILIGDAAAYDALSRLLFGSRFSSIAADIAAAAPSGATVLDVGCGPGHLAITLAGRYGLDVVGLDLDPAMIERARANADRATDIAGRRSRFVLGDVAALPFPDGLFDLVLSTFSVHHWANPTAGLTEIRRVLREDGRVLLWDFKRGFPFHAHMPDPVKHARGALLRVVSVTPWRWPWRLALTQRIELARDSEDPGQAGRADQRAG